VKSSFLTCPGKRLVTGNAHVYDVGTVVRGVNYSNGKYLNREQRIIPPTLSAIIELCEDTPAAKEAVACCDPKRQKFHGLRGRSKAGIRETVARQEVLPEAKNETDREVSILQQGSG
jgi:hypothetical protein